MLMLIRNGQVQGCQDGEENGKEGMEADDYETDFWYDLSLNVCFYAL